MPQKHQPLYAYAMKKADGTLVILHEDIKPIIYGEFNLSPPPSYQIPVSSSEERIKRHYNSLTRDTLEHQLVDISALVENGIISKKSLLNLDGRIEVR